MENEFKAKSKLDKIQLIEIQLLLENKLEFSKTIFENRQIWEFRTNPDLKEMPLVQLEFEKNGIYILQNLENNIWAYLEELKSYFISNNIEIEEIEY